MFFTKFLRVWTCGFAKRSDVALFAELKAESDLIDVRLIQDGIVSGVQDRLPGRFLYGVHHQHASTYGYAAA